MSTDSGEHCSRTQNEALRRLIDENAKLKAALRRVRPRVEVAAGWARSLAGNKDLTALDDLAAIDAALSEGRDE